MSELRKPQLAQTVERQQAILDGVIYAAALSRCGTYRWWLRRQWDPSVADGGRPVVTFVMLNPSTADGMKDDHTVRKCMGFARAWGYGGIEVRNLYPWRATDPKDLRAAHRARRDVCGGRLGEQALRLAAAPELSEVGPDGQPVPGPVVAAWGEQGPLSERGAVFLAMHVPAGVSVWCMGQTVGGQPRHPLYLPKVTRLEPFNGAAQRAWESGVRP